EEHDREQPEDLDQAAGRAATRRPTHASRLRRTAENPRHTTDNRARRLGGEDLVQQNFGLVLVRALGEGELADEDLPRLGEHALLTRGQAALAVAPPEITDDLGDLVDVAAGDLLDVRLVAAGPVGGL